MRIGISGMESFHELADDLADYERAGVGVVNVAELYGFDAVSRLGYLAARSSTAALTSSILPIQLALYVGGMGARTANFYNNLARRYGYEQEAELLQDLYLPGRKKEAEAAVPAELLARTSLIGPEGWVRERLAVLKEAGVTTIRVDPLAADKRGRLALIERLPPADRRPVGRGRAEPGAGRARSRPCAALLPPAPA
jgi:Luciferase-like monooxygenase